MNCGFKYLSLALAALLLMGLLAACGGQADGGEDNRTEEVSFDPDGYDPIVTDGEGFEDNGESAESAEDTEGTENTENTEDGDNDDINLPKIPI